MAKSVETTLKNPSNFPRKQSEQMIKDLFFEEKKMPYFWMVQTLY